METPYNASESTVLKRKHISQVTEDSDDPEAIEVQRRIFSPAQKEACWKRAALIPGRSPDRWRYDAVGNPVCYRLRGCLGCMCHQFDHIVPFSKGGKTVVENCQILQSRVNSLKGNKANDPEVMRTYSCARNFSEVEMDVFEMAVYGDVKRTEPVSGKNPREYVHCRCKSLFEMKNFMNQLRDFIVGSEDDKAKIVIGAIDRVLRSDKNAPNCE